MSFCEKVKSFGMTNMLIENELDGIEKNLILAFEKIVLRQALPKKLKRIIFRSSKRY